VVNIYSKAGSLTSAKRVFGRIPSLPLLLKMYRDETRLWRIRLPPDRVQDAHKFEAISSLLLIELVSVY
jgi:hypothetical protein